MNAKVFHDTLVENDIKFFTGVPDSLLGPFCYLLLDTYKISKQHIIAANEGNAVAIAAGYYLATGKIACVYLQNSGLGGVINPVASLTSERVYGIPCVFVVGWRGEPGVHDEPQHLLQGEITTKMLGLVNLKTFVVGSDTTEKQLSETMTVFKGLLDSGISVAFVVKKDSLFYSKTNKWLNKDRFPLREEVIRAIIEKAKDDVIVSTTGKTSRELFEIREQNRQSHKNDFLTVGSMGQSSSIALGIALNAPRKKVWCLDGDGALLMHMGAMGIIGAKAPDNYIHVLLNNFAHESVGGQPTVAGKISFGKIALACGYKIAFCIENVEDLKMSLNEIDKMKGPIFIEVRTMLGSRIDLGRPTITPLENKEMFMQHLGGNM